MPDRSDPNPLLSDAEEPLSEAEIDSYIQRFTALEKEAQDLHSNYDLAIEEWLRKLAGTHLATMRESQETTLRFMLDSDPDLRQAAIYIAANYWNLADKIKDLCKYIALADPIAEVREAAICALASCYEGTKDSSVGRLIASIIVDENLRDSTRRHAYVSLMSLDALRGSPIDTNLFEVKIEDMNWPFIYSYLQTARPEEKR